MCYEVLIFRVPFFLELFTSTSFPSEVVEEAGICQNCFIRFNEYDEHQTLADHIKNDLIALFESGSENSDRKPAEKVIEDEEISYEIQEEDAGIQEEEIFFPKKIGEDNLEVADEQFIDSFSWTDPKDPNVDDKIPELSQITEVKTQRSKAGRPSEVSSFSKNDMKLFECSICLRLFKEKSKLKAHREIHTTERNVICPVSDYI